MTGERRKSRAPCYLTTSQGQVSATTAEHPQHPREQCEHALSHLPQLDNHPTLINRFTCNTHSLDKMLAPKPQISDMTLTLISSDFVLYLPFSSTTGSPFSSVATSPTPTLTKSYRRITHARMILTSRLASSWPIQFLGPRSKGLHALAGILLVGVDEPLTSALVVVLVSLLPVQRSGTKSFAVGPYTAGSRWMMCCMG